jgi:phage tail P2-like protein
MEGLKMINIHDGQITDLLSNSLRHNPETIAIAYAVLQEKRRILALAERTRLMAAVDSLEERILDYLAVELRTPAYEDSLPLETKRTLIKGTLPYYASLGTPAAVDWVIKAVFGNGGIDEWFNYGGEPHHFQVNIPIAGMITPKMMEELRRMIASVKRLTSWLDSIITYLELDGKVYITPFLGKPMPITTLPEIEPVFPGNLVHLTPVLGDGPQSTTLPTLEPVFATAAIFGRASAALQSITETALPALKENDTTVMPELIEHATAAVQTVTETALPFLEELPPHDMRAVQRISVRPLLPVTETRLPRLEDFSTTLTAVCKGKATAALQNISETRLPELEE